jgi:hypothetical protein
LGWPDEAAEFLASESCRVALVINEYEASFMGRLAQLNRQAVMRERVNGFNHSKGRKESIGVYVLKPL